MPSNALQITDPDASDNPLMQAPSWANRYGSASGVADAVSVGVDRLGQWLAEQRAKSARMGLWDDVRGMPTGRGLVNAAQQTGNALLMGTTAPGVRAFHGSPYDFERFDTSKIGTGEGAQAYGHGLYFAEAEPVAQQYRDLLRWRGSNYDDPQVIAQAAMDRVGGDRAQAAANLQAALDSTTSFYRGNVPAPQAAANANNARAIDLLRGSDPITGKPPTSGKMYEVNIGADPEHFLHWDKPLKEQPEVLKKIEPLVSPDMLKTFQYNVDRGITGGNAYHNYVAGNPAATSDALRVAGIPGIRYLDQGSRGAGEGTHNYVVFDAATIDILRKYGIAGLMLGGTAAAGSQQQPPMAQ